MFPFVKNDYKLIVLRYQEKNDYVSMRLAKIVYYITENRQKKLMKYTSINGGIKMDYRLKEAFEVILNRTIFDEKGKVYYYYYWDEYFPEFVVKFLNKEELKKIPDGIVELPKNSYNISMYEKHFIDLNNSLFMIEEEYNFFSKFGEKVVNEVNKKVFFIDKVAYLKGSSLIDIVKRFEVDIKKSKNFKYATIVAKVHTDGTLYNALSSLFCTTYGYENIIDIDEPIKKLDEDWKGVFDNISEPIKSHIACFFQNENTARSEGACYSDSINSGGCFEEFVKCEGNNCIIQLQYGEGQAESFILEIDKESLLCK